MTGRVNWTNSFSCLCVVAVPVIISVIILNSAFI